ncbi:hypothetical protein [Vibrio sp. CK2-1]|uniref:hypothetical protein n=1 Tax=Vibrio sp. CK2-1 TaxID=2912249 RepID=UPI001F46088A|nr:hypothetical protein [Vibrio sp. CK2-1]MCF7353169.1 hypothetical protein [Vibrio sp. CK2-1]
MKSGDVQSLRKNDFKIALVLLTVCAFLFWETSSYPMDGTFGGVDSKWYVSPALFPLVLLSLLTVSCLYLLFKSYPSISFQSMFSFSSWLGKLDSAVNTNRWYVILILSLYIYFYIPSSDFYLATVVFLLSMFSRFYTDNAVVKRSSFFINILLLSIILISRLVFSEEFYFISLDVSYDEKLILSSDLGMLTSIVLLTLLLVVNDVDKKKKINILIVSIIVPLVLVFTFNFLLQVPMPVEYGNVIMGMEYIWYDILNL